MKIYNRKDFLKLPSGTLYWEVGALYGSNTLNIKLENNDENDDFLMIGLVYDELLEHYENKELYDKFKDYSECIDLTGGWDKMYNEDTYYVALEKKDWEDIKKLVDEAY